MPPDIVGPTLIAACTILYFLHHRLRLLLLRTSSHFHPHPHLHHSSVNTLWWRYCCLSRCYVLDCVPGEYECVATNTKLQSLLTGPFVCSNVWPRKPPHQQSDDPLQPVLLIEYSVFSFKLTASHDLAICFTFPFHTPVDLSKGFFVTFYHHVSPILRSQPPWQEKNDRPSGDPSVSIR